MEVFVLFKKAFSFFVELGSSVNFLGLDLWGLSFVFFLGALVFRFLFPLIFQGVGSGIPNVSSWVRSQDADKVRNARKK